MIESKETGREDHGGVRSSQRFHFSQGALAIAALLFLVVGVIYAFTATFGQFRAYDDEGFLMITVRGYLEGNSLYDQVYTVYGPVYYFYEWGLHKLAAIPLTNDATAALCVAHWVLGAFILAFAGFRLTRSLPMAAFVFMQAIVHLDSLANEPGHPQEVVVLMLSLASVVAVRGLKNRQTLPLLAAIGTGLIFTKINVGGFFGMALAFSMLCCSSGGRWVRAVVWGFTLLGGIIAPALLMQSHFDEAWARYYSLQITLSILAVGIVANSHITERVIRLRDWLRAAIVSIALSAMILCLLLITGSSPAAIWVSLVSSASKIGSAFYMPLHLEPWSWSAWAALLLAALTARLKKQEATMSLLIALIKVIFGIAGTWVLVFEPTAQLGCLLPWSWLLVAGAEKNDSGLFSRIFLSFLAVWQGLQAYPVAGSQASVGTFVGVLVFSMCLWDGTRALAGMAILRPALEKIASARACRLAQVGIILALLLVFLMNWCNPIHEWRDYQTKQSMGLPGCQYRRVNQTVAMQYRELAQLLKAKSDTFIVFPGLNSLYLWTGKQPPTYFIVSGEGTLPSAFRQEEIIKVLKRAKRPLVVLRKLTWSAEMAPGAPKEGPLADFIRDECVQIGAFQVGTSVKFRILAPKSQQNSPH